MTELGVVEDTLFVPMVGRIYASESCRKVLYDEKALELKDSLPEGLVAQSLKQQSEYNMIASASRSANMDRYIKNFIKRKPNGVIIQLGCGLETTFSRDDNGETKWYSIDLPNVIEYRKGLLPESERETCIAGDAFSEEWIEQVRSEVGEAPLLVTASGLFYYFEEETVITLFRMLQNHGDIEVVFDSVNKSGIRMMQKKYMKQVGHADAKMFFYVDSAAALAAQIGGSVVVLAEEKYYQYISREGLKISTRISMNVSDLLTMVKMVHLHL